MKKKARQQIIKSIIEQKDISTQFELVQELAKKGIPVNQPTLSRDLREMNVVKAPKGLGKFVYQMGKLAETVNTDIFKSKFMNIVTDIVYTGNLILVKTPLGEAQGVARAIDNALIEHVLGTVGGDDTIIIVVDKAANVKKVLKIFEAARQGKL